ncbi:glycosyltransferase [Streptomyces sp. NL15-2K]|uniref:glycosyltransferase n=1 Tax=Streptomyces sp. NL15-2K TaxID=376149 RepID=UPI000FFA2E29|nr:MULTISPECIES: nucleotide disphospho-sugar-binding domain-containing protein [Actinomycetes]WKX11335.1 glycosyltransferase [Kutzneria buriramensis]GCB47257.1 MGT family glycosyltransferase [Streptomyces sp. NL15-2K]
MRTAGRTVLFFPWSHGVGFGYVGRSLTIAKELATHGVRCLFACDTKEGHVRREGFALADPADEYATAVPDMGSRQGAYIAIDGLDTVYAMSRYYHAERIRRELEANLRLIRSVQPDLVVVDLSPTGAMAARITQVPLVSVGDSDYFRDEDLCWMPPVQHERVRRPYPSCLPAFTEVLAEHGLPAITHVSDLLWGDLTLIASVELLEKSQPPIRSRGPMSLVGPIEWEAVDDEGSSDARLEEFGEPGRRLYISLGHGGKYTVDQLGTLVEGATSAGWSCLVGAGFRPPDGLSVAESARVRSVPFVGLDRPLGWADAVVHHGGYTTVFATLRHRKPAVVIPFMSEQEANAAHFVESTGAGFLLRKLTLGTGREYLTFAHRYRPASTDPTVTPHDLRLALDEVGERGAFTPPTEVAASIDDARAQRDLTTDIGTAGNW